MICKKNSTHNNEADAFKHTYMQAELALNGTQGLAKYFGDKHEEKGNKVNSQPKGEEIMDLHNNEKGRQIAKEMIDKYGYAIKNPLLKHLTNDMIADEIWKKMKNGEIILDPSGRTTLKNFPKDEQLFIKSAPKPAWDKHGNLTGLATDIKVGGDGNIIKTTG